MSNNFKNDTVLDKMSFRKQKIHSFLSKHKVGVLSSVDPEGLPHGVVIYYTIDQFFKIYFLTKRMTKKYQNLSLDHHVMLTVFEERTLTTLQLVGLAKEILDVNEVNEIADELFHQTKNAVSGGEMPIAKLNEGPYVAFSVKPVSIRMAVYKGADSGDYNELFDSLESFDFEP